MTNHVKVRGVDCYGELRDDSNFLIVCEDEEYDGTWADGNPRSPDYTFENWTQVVAVLTSMYRKDIVEISAV